MESHKKPETRQAWQEKLTTRLAGLYELLIQCTESRGNFAHDLHENGIFLYAQRVRENVDKMLHSFATDSDDQANSSKLLKETAIRVSALIDKLKKSGLTNNDDAHYPELGLAFKLGNHDMDDLKNLLTPPEPGPSDKSTQQCFVNFALERNFDSNEIVLAIANYLHKESQHNTFEYKLEHKNTPNADLVVNATAGHEISEINIHHMGTLPPSQVEVIESKPPTPKSHPKKTAALEHYKQGKCLYENRADLEACENFKMAMAGFNDTEDMPMFVKIQQDLIDALDHRALHCLAIDEYEEAVENLLEAIENTRQIIVALPADSPIDILEKFKKKLIDYLIRLTEILANQDIKPDQPKPLLAFEKVGKLLTYLELDVYQNLRSFARCKESLAVALLRYANISEKLNDFESANQNARESAGYAEDVIDTLKKLPDPNSKDRIMIAGCHCLLGKAQIFMAHAIHNYASALTKIKIPNKVSRKSQDALQKTRQDKLPNIFSARIETLKEAENNFRIAHGECLETITELTTKFFPAPSELSSTEENSQAYYLYALENDGHTLINCSDNGGRIMEDCIRGLAYIDQRINLFSKHLSENLAEEEEKFASAQHAKWSSLPEFKVASEDEDKNAEPSISSSQDELTLARYSEHLARDLLQKGAVLPAINLVPVAIKHINKAMNSLKNREPLSQHDQMFSIFCYAVLALSQSTFASALNAEGNLMSKTQNFARALKDFEEAIKLFNDSEVITHRAYAHLQANINALTALVFPSQISNPDLYLQHSLENQNNLKNYQKQGIEIADICAKNLKQIHELLPVVAQNQHACLASQEKVKAAADRPGFFELIRGRRKNKPDEPGPGSGPSTTPDHTQ